MRACSMVLDEHHKEGAVFRFVVPHVEVDSVHTAVTPAVQDDVLDQEVRRVGTEAVFWIETKFVGYVGDELLNKSVEAFLRLWREWKAVQICPFGVRNVDVEGQRRSPRRGKLP